MTGFRSLIQLQKWNVRNDAGNPFERSLYHCHEGRALLADALRRGRISETKPLYRGLPCRPRRQLRTTPLCRTPVYTEYKNPLGDRIDFADMILRAAGYAVGDDRQSIFRFAGSKIQLMRQFGEAFSGSFAGAHEVRRTVDLGRTFCSVEQVAYSARTSVPGKPEA